LRRDNLPHHHRLDDLVLVAAGVTPCASLGLAAGVRCGATGAIRVDEQQRTGSPGIFAAGDCAEARHLLLRRAVYLPLGTTANRQGRIAGRIAAGGSGTADDWAAIQAGVREVRDAARAYLEGLDESDLDVVIPYAGSFAHLRDTGLGLRYALMRTCAHHYFHIGEIATERSRLGQRVGDYPGLLEECV
jgi:NADH dehydrogenase FAD-containing subunit